MPFMPKEHCEQQHHSMPNVSMRQMLAGFLLAQRGESLPAEDQREGEIHAILNHGLWIGRCPKDYCYGEVAVSTNDPVMVCVDCGAGWFDIIFPKNISAIEKEVEKRPKNPLGMPHANWRPGESVAKLRRETEAGRDVP